MDEQYDYFESKEEPEKEADITWNVNSDDNSSSTDGNQSNDEQSVNDLSSQEETSETTINIMEQQEPKSFWGKMKDLLK